MAGSRSQAEDILLRLGTVASTVCHPQGQSLSAGVGRWCCRAGFMRVHLPPACKSLTLSQERGLCGA